MKKIITAIFAIIICLFTMTGCMKKSLPDLPNDAIEFDMGTFHDNEHDDALFGSIEYGGRVYIPYGTVNNRYNRSCIDSCIGYIIQNEHAKLQKLTEFPYYMMILRLIIHHINCF